MPSVESPSSLVRSNWLCGVIDDEDGQWALGAGGDPHPLLRNWKSGFGWCSGVSFSLFQVFKNLPNHLVLGNESDHAQSTSTITAQRLGLIHSLDELCPAFSESGTLFWREVRFFLGRGGSVGTERLKDEASFFSVSPRSRRIGPEISDAVCPRLGNLCENSGNKLEYVEGLALRMGEQRVVVGGFALVE